MVASGKFPFLDLLRIGIPPLQYNVCSLVVTIADMVV